MSRPSSFLTCGLFFLLGILPAMAGQHTPVTASGLREEILSLEQVRRGISVRVQEDADLTEREQRELLSFADSLQERKRDFCRSLARQGGPDAITDLPCPPPRTPMPAMTATTVQEDLDSLEAALAASLGEFDDMLLTEQERLAARQPRERESGGRTSSTARGGRGSSGGSHQAGQTGRGGRQGAGTGQGRGQAGSGPHSTATAGESHPAGADPGGGSGGVGGTVKPTKSTPVATDDDIVARQLREAAEKETDPELKEKLWEEYRRYKSVSR